MQLVDLPGDIRHYLLRVMLDDEGIERLTISENPIMKKEALSEKGIRLAEKGKWHEALRIVRLTDTPNTGLWEKAASLSIETDFLGRLKWARFLKENNGKLFYGNDIAWYRSLNWRIRRIQEDQQRLTVMLRRSSQQIVDQQGIIGEQKWTHELPWTAEDEQNNISQHLLRTTEMWMSLQVYADILSTIKPLQELPELVKEADVCYNWLINWDSTNSSFWKNYLSEHVVVNKISEAGKLSRKL